jgi:hypothetical protein
LYSIERFDKKDNSKKYSVVKWTRKVNENEAAC